MGADDLANVGWSLGIGKERKRREKKEKEKEIESIIMVRILL